MDAYELLEVVGVGGMGTVYRGRHRGTGQVVAIKMMTASFAADPVLFRRFEQEYRAACRLSHPNIVEPIDFGMEGDRPYLVMEYVEGPSLGERVRADGPLPEEEAVRIIVQVASALQAAHEHRLIHRDVKPDNILLTRDGQAKLADLGLVKDLDANTLLTQPRAWLGTLGYMAPEQFEEARVAEPRCDIYSLAATLYHTLTGAVPFPGQGGLTILRKKLANDFVPPRILLPTLRPGLNEVICRSLNARPESRPGTCQEFADLITAALTAESVSETLPSADSPENRRTAVRYPSSLAVLCRDGGGNKLGAEVQDVSLRGICLQLGQRIEVGNPLSLELPPGKDRSGGGLLAKVRWVRGAVGKWRLGCQFEKDLTTRELDALIGTSFRTAVMERERDTDSPPSP